MSASASACTRSWSSGRASSADPDSITEHLRGQLAAYKLPTSFEFVDDLPREPNGKVRKRQMRDERMAGASAE